MQSPNTELQMTDTRNEVPVLEVENLAISYKTRYGMVPAVRDVSFKLNRGESFGIV